RGFLRSVVRGTAGYETIRAALLLGGRNSPQDPRDSFRDTGRRSRLSASWGDRHAGGSPGSMCRDRHSFGGLHDGGRGRRVVLGREAVGQGRRTFRNAGFDRGAGKGLPALEPRTVRALDDRELRALAD